MTDQEFLIELANRLKDGLSRAEIEKIVEKKIFELLPNLSLSAEDYSASTEQLAEKCGCSSALIRKMVREGVFTSQEVLARGSNFSFRPLAALRRFQEHSARLLSIPSGLPEDVPNNVVEISSKSGASRRTG